MAEKWAKTSAPPSSGVMNPKPLSALNHFTTPVTMLVSSTVDRSRHHRRERGGKTRIFRVSCRRTDRPYRSNPGYDKERPGQNSPQALLSSWQTKLTTLGS